jgi:DNA-binding HxlR family transcriptional regulator
MRSILNAIQGAGEIATPDIVKKMTMKFSNPRSINLALRELEKRGLVYKAESSRKQLNRWRLTEKGAEFSSQPSPLEA